jgi:hypothetical protein
MMELRDCRLIFHGSIGNWPPVWVRKGDDASETLRGEIGTLKEVRASILKPYQRCFLIMEHGGAEYVGCLLFRHQPFCKHVYELLLRYYGRPIQEIGGIDVSPVIRPKPRGAIPARRTSAFSAE